MSRRAIPATPTPTPARAAAPSPSSMAKKRAALASQASQLSQSSQPEGLFDHYGMVTRKNRLSREMRANVPPAKQARLKKKLHSFIFSYHYPFFALSLLSYTNEEEISLSGE